MDYMKAAQRALNNINDDEAKEVVFEQRQNMFDAMKEMLDDREAIDDIAETYRQNVL